MEKKINNLAHSAIEWRALNYLDLDKDQSKKMVELLIALEQLDDVQNIFTNANLDCDFIGRSYKGRGFSCGFAVIEDLKGFCYIKNNNNKDILIIEWACNTTAGINGDAYCAGKLNVIQGFGIFAGVNGFGEINMPIAKSINSNMSSPLNINLNIKYPMSLNK